MAALSDAGPRNIGTVSRILSYTMWGHLEI